MNLDISENANSVVDETREADMLNWEYDMPDMACDPPVDSEANNQTTPDSNSKHACVEEEQEQEQEENEDSGQQWYIEDFPLESKAGTLIWQSRTKFEDLKSNQCAAGNEPWHPFADEADWKLAHWLTTSGVSQKKLEDFLKLKVICDGAQPSSQNVRSLLAKIDSLPTGPKWSYTAFNIVGNELDHEGKPLTETMTLWKWDPVECIRELIGNPAFKDNLFFEMKKERTVSIEKCGLPTGDHFNISKLHNIKHYCDAIHSQGTADGFSTEGTECLHIDLAKMGYNASNKKDYTSQMAKWLQRQESIHHFGVYMQWVTPGYVMELSGIEVDVDSEDRMEGDTAMNNDESNSDEATGTNKYYSIAKSAPYPSVSVPDITTIYGAADFLYYLEEFVQDNSDINTPVAFGMKTLFPIYKQFTLELPPIPEISHCGIVDVVHATPSQAAKVTVTGPKEATSGQSSTVLVRVKKAEKDRGPLDGLRVAQVRLIFNIPEEYGSYAHPLAYVHWFKPFQANPVKVLDMFQVSLSTNMHVQHAEVISIMDII
ncbi:hypothetical protein BDQ17DRAFT_1328249 [Cyathus striatus]|nr:hypothetical protein BDQ17DRAFT_1328249 [Cyathus striatus]